MPDTNAHSALRRTLTHMTQPVTMIALVGATIILSLAAPFNTRAFLTPLPLVCYWAVLSCSTYALGYLVTEVLSPRVQDLTFPIRVAIIASVTGAAITVLVMVLNVLTFGILPGGWSFWTLTWTIFPLSVAIAALITILAQHLVPVSALPSPPDQAPSPLLDRLAFEDRAPLVALSVEDHYVRIRTTKGETMVLLRLGDAIRETAGTDGMQVHRSHWVATEHVTAARREGDRAVLTLAHGPDIPVSRSYVPAIRAAGLLPKS